MQVVNVQRGIVKGDSEVPFFAGERVSIRDLLYALMLPSADDGAWILADLSTSLSQSRKEFIKIQRGVYLGLHAGEEPPCGIVHAHQD